jgi:hypothetical protein
MKLVDEGYVKVAGGCVAYMQGEITFAPQEGGGVRVVVDNDGGWFRGGGSGPFHGYDTVLPQEEAATFFADLKDLLDHPEKPEHGPSTMMSVVEIYLPLAGGTIETTWREADGAYDLGPLLKYLQESVIAFTLL